MKFPKKLFVKQDQDGTHTYFVPSLTIDETASAGESEDVAVYVRKEVLRVKGTVTILKKKEKKNGKKRG